MKRFLLLFLLLSGADGFVTAQQTGSTDSLIWREMKERRIPGLQVAVIQHGKIVFASSYGIANLEYGVPVTGKTLFDINSCTKAFTGVAIMQLVEAGKIKLDSPLSLYLDSLAAAWQPITIRQLLTHVSGLPDITRVLNAAAGGLEQLGGEQVAWSKTAAMPMDFPAGEKYRYNQTNYALLGKIIDKYSGEPFARFFKDRQFLPADLSQTGFGGSRDVIPDMAQTYMYVSSLDGVKLDKEKLINSYADFPLFRRTGSGMISTAGDIGKWLIALKYGAIFHQAGTLDTLWTAGHLNNGNPTLWALGWVTWTRAKHSAIMASGGGRSAFIVYPKDDLAIVVLTNLAGAFPERFFDELAGLYVRDIADADPVTALHIQLRKRGFDQAMVVVNELKRSIAGYELSNSDLNDWGYQLSSNGQISEALAIFQLNVQLHPGDWNAYDSYGEILLNNGHKAEAIKMYTRSVELNPDNENGKKVLQQLNK